MFCSECSEGQLEVQPGDHRKQPAAAAADAAACPATMKVTVDFEECLKDSPRFRCRGEGAGPGSCRGTGSGAGCVRGGPGCGGPRGDRCWRAVASRLCVEEQAGAVVGPAGLWGL